MEDANGSLKGSKPSPSALNGHAVGPRRSAPTGPGLLARTFNIVARLLTWYSILTILLRCPATLDACDETSPRICKPYFQLKHTVTPHLEPYYDAYAAPYVELVRPYYNTVDQRVIAPGWGYAKKYGAPRVEQAQAFGRAQWEKNVHPQIVKCQSVAKSQYDNSLAPHVNQVSSALGPYYDIARTNALQTYHELLLPSYQYVHPYVQKTYTSASAFTKSTAVPSVLWAWNKTYVFLDGTVWPQLRVVYVENVEPQLVKIGKRLGRYSSNKKSIPKSIPESASPSSKTTSWFAKPTPSVTSTTVSSSQAVSSSTASSATSSTALSETPSSRVAQAQSSQAPADSAKTRLPIEPPEVDEKLESEDPVRREARETVAADLKDWQERYSKAADEGAAEIDNRVQEISKRMIRRNARIMGKSLLEQLQSAVVSELVKLRRDILSIVGSVNKEGATPEQGQEQITNVVRRAGMEIKDKAQDIRTWRENYEAEMQAAITKAAETHFLILENIKDLALQKIGMKWAWMDGVTYKDWAKYHLLKSRFDEWKGDLENLIVTHPSLEAAQLEGANIEDEAMKIAASAARELARLKQVGNWKLIAADETPEFDSTLMQQAAEAVESAKNAASSVVHGVGEAAQDVKDATAQKVEEGGNLVVEAVEGATDAIKNVKNAVVDQAARAVKSASSLVLPSHASEPVESAVSEAAESASVASEELSTVIEPISEATASVEDPQADSAETATPDLASTIILTETPIIIGNTSELIEEGPAPIELPIDEEDRASAADDTEESPASSATASVKSAFLGAAAQSVPSRKPIIEDTLDDASGALDSMREELKSAYSVAVSRANEQYSQALSVMSVQIHGTPEPAHQKMLASVTAAYSQAMASASSRLDDALLLASQKVYGTPTVTNKILPSAVPTIPSVDWAHIESIAAERLSQGRAWAEEQYESAKIAVGLAAPTPSTPAEHANKLLENARFNYYAGLGVAHARYSEFLAAASSAVSSLTATPTPTDLAGTASSVASVFAEKASSAASPAAEKASSAASAASAGASSAASAASAGVSSAASAAVASASSVASAASAGVSSAASVVGENVSSVAGDVVESWDVLVTKISVQIYGAPTPTPWYESAYNVVGEYASSATEAIADGAASIASAAGNYGGAASNEAAGQYDAVSSLISELIVGKEPTFSESVLSRLNAAYATAASSASSLASVAQATAASAAVEGSEIAQSVRDKIASAGSEFTEAAKETAGHDEL
ncbi:hypothetical protein B0H67DRAFT_647347 [Lasiosphaeris hirsuta]|uniref:Transcription factor hoxa13 n=1 Tax=Lasiosphaeris hirsuta TaxID=260670 RepID=A0AA40A9Z8_9PEZI|nr:hypothetical protein B0H67DRAFT_647347 [Lasiosphaeris hirsuta]